MDNDRWTPAGTPPISTEPIDFPRSSQSPADDFAAKSREKAQAVGKAAVHAIDQNREPAARVLSDAASAISDRARRLPPGTSVARLADTTAAKIDATARYVREHDAQQMMDEVKAFVKRNPGAAVLGAAVVGVLVGRGFRRT
jgi:ElaB/YqjD/DUF883 family membrane-anchored ribosome-binding protein